MQPIDIFVLGLSFILFLAICRIIISNPKDSQGNEFIELFFSFNSITLKIKGGLMTTEMSSKQRFEFDVLFKNKNGNSANVDGSVPCSFVDPNTGDPLTTTATATATAVDPDENGNSSKHHVVVETSADEITSIITAALQVEPDVDMDNDKDDSTTEDVKKTKFSLMTVVFAPLQASQAGVENVTPVVDL